MKTPAVALALAAFITTPSLGQRVPPDLQTAMKQRADALQRADAATWGRLTADNFVVVAGNGTVQTKAERIAQITAGQPNGPSSVEHETVQVHGNSAVQRFQSTRDGVWFAFVWAKDRTGWRVTYAQVTPIIPDSGSVWRAIAEQNARFSDSFTRGDASGLASHYADGAVVMLANGPAWDGTAAIKQGFMDFLNGAAVPKFQLTTHDIIIDLGIAIERGTYEMTIHPKSATGTDIIDKGKYITIWEQQPDGTWKISRDISNSDNPPSR